MSKLKMLASNEEYHIDYSILACQFEAVSTRGATSH